MLNQLLQPFMDSFSGIPAFYIPEQPVNENLPASTIEGYKPHTFCTNELALLDIRMNYSDDSNVEALHIYQINEETGEISLLISFNSPFSR
ncbi:hypothetical protein [Jeotgalibacillus marinus]|uniref:Uncharacterized protein n=1 Tax=Jeotgalibacillus marinus TaxID=86667 RepID=A0ABV3Q4Y7_9BACL